MLLTNEVPCCVGNGWFCDELLIITDFVVDVFEAIVIAFVDVSDAVDRFDCSPDD